MSITSVSQPTSGTGTLVSSGSGSWTFAPVSNFAGTTSFSYTISDGNGGTAIGQATVKVRQVYTSTSSVSIRDNGVTTTSINVADTATIRDLNVRINLTHSALNQLSVVLISPTGVRIQMLSGLTGSNLINTTLDDDASSLITSGSAPYSGAYRPTGNLTSVEGAQLKGIWTLEITDSVRNITGTLTNWTIFAEV